MFGGGPMGGIGPRGQPLQQQMMHGSIGPGPGWKRQHSMPGGPHHVHGMGGPGGMGMMGPGGFPGGPGNFQGNNLPNMHHLGAPPQQFKGQQGPGPMHGLGPQHRMMMNGGSGPGEMGMHSGIGPGGGNGNLPPPYHQTQRSNSVPMGIGGNLQSHSSTSPLHPGVGAAPGVMGPRPVMGGPPGMPHFQKEWPGNGPMDVNSNNNSIGKLIVYV